MTDFLQTVRRQLKMPALFLAVCALAFGPQIPWLGYYLDDWIILNAYLLGGAERLFEYAFLGNRPLVFWQWWLGFELLGAAPAGWHVWALFWRWLTVVILWLGWQRLWPSAPRQTAFAALLFAVYPLFKQQPSALTFSFHWISFFLYGLSLYWMIRSVQRPRRFYPLMLGALLADFLQLYSQEFFVGLELFRPVVLWLALPGGRWQQRLRRTLFYWAPYLLLLVFNLYWRLALMPTPGTDRNTPGLMYGLLTAPLQAAAELVTMVLQNVVEMLLGVWYRTVAPEVWVLAPAANLVAWGLAALTAFLLAAVFLPRGGWPWRRRPSAAEPAGELEVEPGPHPWYRQAIPAGLLAMLFGFAPGWSIGRHITDLAGIYNDRFGLAAMFGASLLIVGLVELLLRKETYRVALLCLLVGLAVGQSFRTTSEYRWSWEKQLRMYWQLNWRAPGLRAPTAILADGGLVGYIGSWATTSALAQMYAPEKDTHWMDFWYYDISKVDLSAHVEQGEPIVDERNFMRYAAPARSSLAISYKPDEQQCLWVLTEEDRASRYLTEKERDALPLTSLEQILPEGGGLRADIFGPEARRDWCYYYQKGDLARQFARWDEAARLWEAAEAEGLDPAVGIEYGPFIEAYARLEDYDQAIALTRRAYFPDFVMRETLCDTWERIAQTATAGEARSQALATVADDFDCDPARLR